MVDLQEMSDVCHLVAFLQSNGNQLRPPCNSKRIFIFCFLKQCQCSRCSAVTSAAWASENFLDINFLQSFSWIIMGLHESIPYSSYWLENVQRLLNPSDQNFFQQLQRAAFLSLCMGSFTFTTQAMLSIFNNQLY